MKIQLRPVQGSSREGFDVETNPEQLIEDLKREIERQKPEYPAVSQKLLHKGKILADGTTITNYSIQEGDFIVLMVSKKSPAGGPAPHPKIQPSVAPLPPASHTIAPGAPANVSACGAPPEALVKQLMDMGFDRGKVVQCLEAAFNEPNRAIEYLMSGIPAGVQQQERTRRGVPEDARSRSPRGHGRHEHGHGQDSGHGHTHGGEPCAGHGHDAGHTHGGEACAGHGHDAGHSHGGEPCSGHGHGGGAHAHDSSDVSNDCSGHSHGDSAGHSQAGHGGHSQTRTHGESNGHVQGHTAAASLGARPNGGRTGLAFPAMPAPGASGGGGVAALETVRNNPRFPELAEMVRRSPETLTQLVPVLGQGNPDLILAINQNREAFMQMLQTAAAPTAGAPDAGAQDLFNDDLPGVGRQRSDSDASDLSGHGLEGGLVQITAEDEAALKRLEALGFPEEKALQAYLACERKENETANLLLDS